MSWEYILFIDIKFALACVNINVLICMFFIDLILMHLIELLKISTVLTYFYNNSQQQETFSKKIVLYINLKLMYLSKERR